MNGVLITGWTGLKKKTRTIVTSYGVMGPCNIIDEVAERAARSL